MHRFSRFLPPLARALALFGAAALAACQAQDQPAEDQNAAQEPMVNLPMVPRPAPPLDRAALLAAVTQAASASAAGSEMPESVRSLDGRQFELRIRFGCRGPSEQLEDKWLGWSYDPENRRIHLRAKPTISMNDPLISIISGDSFEAVEGFWIPRPWLQQAVCPAAAAVASAADQQQTDASQAPNAQRQDDSAAPADNSEEATGEPVPSWPRVGIAQFFTDEDPRTRRRGDRPYEARHTLAEGKAISSQGYNLVLTGRLRALPGRGVIECSARDANSPPECVISAEFQRVWIEEPGSGEVIAQWGSG